MTDDSQQPSDLDKIKANEVVDQKSNIFQEPSLVQPQAIQNPQDEALQRPAIDPIDLAGGAIAGAVAAPLVEGAEALARPVGQFLADEAGVVPLNQAARQGMNLYNIHADPEGLIANTVKANGAADPEAITSAIKKAGYDGLHSPGHPTHETVLFADAPTAQQSLAQDTQQRGVAGYQADVAKLNKANRYRKYADGGEVAPDAATTPQQTPLAAPGASPQGSIQGLEGTPQPDSQAAPQQPAGVNVVSPEGDIGALDPSVLKDAIANGYRLATPEELDHHFKEEKYGSGGQQAIAGLEGLAQGIAGPIATAAERGLGVKPEDMLGRQEANPITHGIGQAAGLIGGSALGVGEGAALEGAGAAVKGAIGLGEGATRIQQIGAEAASHAFQGALFQGGEELTKAYEQDPSQTASSAMMDIGMTAILNGAFGGAIGGILSKAPGAAVDAVAAESPGAFVSQLDRAALDAGDLKTSIANSDNLKPEFRDQVLGGLLDRAEKPDAKEIRAAADRLGAPVYEGMVSGNKMVQKGEDSLLNGAPTYSGLKRQALYKEAYDKANAAVEDAMGDPSRYTKAELGDVMKSSISEQLQAQNKPIADLYDMIKESHSAIPLSEKSAPAIARNLEKIPELRLSPSSPEGQLANRVIKEIGNLKTVDDVKTYKSILNRSLSPTASSGEKRMAAIIGDKLTDLEESSIERFAQNEMKTPAARARVLDLIDQRKAANAQYAEMINKVKTLSEQLGKGRVYGIKDALNFINEKLTPEEVVQRLGTNKDSAFRKFFAKEFPEQHELMKEYQKGALRAQATTGDVLSNKKLFNNINKLEPEIQKSIFNPQELQKLKDAETYVRSFPEKFNPSGTSGMDAYRSFFMSPKGALLGNARDFAIEQYIKNVASSTQVKNSVALAQATVKGEKTATNAIKSLFTKADMPQGALPAIAQRVKLDNVVQMYAKNPDALLKIGANNPIPPYAAAFGNTGAKAVQHLNQIRPNTDKKAPLDQDRKPNSVEQSNYNKALDITQNPLVVISKMQNGTLTQTDMQTLKAVHPEAYQSLSQKMTKMLTEHTAKGNTIPYATRLQISKFLGQPVDSTMLPASIIAAQQSNNPTGAPQQQGQPQQKKGNTSKLGGLAKSAMTATQSREAARASSKD